MPTGPMVCVLCGSDDVIQTEMPPKRVVACRACLAVFTYQPGPPAAPPRIEILLPTTPKPTA